MTRPDAIKAAKAHASPWHSISDRIQRLSREASQGNRTWGSVAEYVLDKTGRADLSDAIWSG